MTGNRLYLSGNGIAQKKPVPLPGVS